MVEEKDKERDGERDGERDKERYGEMHDRGMGYCSSLRGDRFEYFYRTQNNIVPQTFD